MIRRAAPDGDSTSAQLAALEARHDQARKLIEDLLRRHTHGRPAGEPANRPLLDALLDVRLALKPPRRDHA